MSTLTITDKAMQALDGLGMPEGAFLRLSVVPGGCSGRTYAAAVDTALDEADVILYESGNLQIVSDPDSADYLDGIQIDYSDDLIRSGFRFKNPNVCGSCGCGASFGG